MVCFLLSYSLTGAETVEAHLVGGAGADLELGLDGAVGTQGPGVAAGDDVHIVQGADHLVQLGQDDDLVGVAAGDNGVGQGVGVGQGLALAVLSGVLVGDDGGLHALELDLLGVHDQIGVRVAEALLADDGAVQIQQAAQLGGPVGGALLVGQIDVLVGDDVADVVEGLAVGGEHGLHHRVVLVVVGGVLVAGGHAVAADDGAVHGLGGVDDGGQGALGVHAVDVGVVEQALTLEHVDVGHAGQVGILLDALLDAQGLKLLGLVGGHVPAQLADEDGGPQTGDAHGVLILVLVVLVALGGLGDDHEVIQLAERGVVGAGAGHVDDALLEADDLAG